MDTELHRSQHEAGHCPLCGWPIESAWVRHNGLKVHPLCWERTGDQPDILRGIAPKD